MDIRQLKSLNILIIGDSCTDVYNYGTCDRISPEAPVPVLRTTHREEKPGMALNVQKNLEAMGHNTMILTNSEKIIKERFVDERNMQHLLRVDSGEQERLAPMSKKLIKTVRMSGFEYHCVVISDYDKGFICNENCKDIISSLRNQNVVVFVDSKKTDLSCYEECILKLNEFEFSKIEKAPINTEIVVTLGSKGARWRDDIFGTEPTSVFDVCGAGDTFLSAFVTAYMSTFSFSDSIKFANKCAGLSVKKFGNHIVSLEDLK